MKRKPRTHEVKAWPAFFVPVSDGSKPFEIRKNDGFQVGDTLHIREWCPTKRDYTGHECWAVVTYVTAWQQIKNHVVLGIRLVQQDAVCTQLGVPFSKLPHG